MSKPGNRPGATPLGYKQLKKLKETSVYKKLDKAFQSAQRPARRRPPEYPLHVLVAIHRRKKRNPLLRYAELVETFCPCLAEFPQRCRHGPACCEALRRVYRRFRNNTLAGLGPAAPYLLQAGRRNKS